MRRRVQTSLLLSIALHVVLGAALLRVILMPLPLDSLFRRGREAPLPVEKIGFIALPQHGAKSTPGRSGGNGRAETPARPKPLLRPPGPTSSALPPPAAASVEESGSGPVVGTPGPARGARPSFSDPRVWVPPADVVSAPKTPTERLDSTFQSRLKAHQDSVELAAGPRRDPTDWTLERDGKKYGIDKTYIHLGNLRLPTALLALLPMNAQGNQQAIDRERALNAMHNDIMYQAQRAMNEDEFRNAVRNIRERKQKERERAQRQQQAGAKSDAATAVDGEAN